MNKEEKTKLSGPPVLRSAVNKDAGKIQNLVFEALKEYGLNPDPGETDADLQNIENNYISRGGIFKVLEYEPGKIIGCYGLYPIDKITCELRKMYLVKSERGKGFGRMMLDSAIEGGGKLGFTQIILETASVLKEAINLYVSYGFKPYESDHISTRCDQWFSLPLGVRIKLELDYLYEKIDLVSSKDFNNILHNHFGIKLSIYKSEKDKNK